MGGYIWYNILENNLVIHIKLKNIFSSDLEISSSNINLLHMHK